MAKIKIERNTTSSKITVILEQGYRVIGGHSLVHLSLLEVEKNQPVTKDEMFFLPSKISGLLTDNGRWEKCWLRLKTDEEIISELLTIRGLFIDHPVKAVRYTEELTTKPS